MDFVVTLFYIVVCMLVPVGGLNSWSTSLDVVISEPCLVGSAALFGSRENFSRNDHNGSAGFATLLCVSDRHGIVYANSELYNGSTYDPKYLLKSCTSRLDVSGNLFQPLRSLSYPGLA